jgi:hypothetical protein
MEISAIRTKIPKMLRIYSPRIGIGREGEPKRD